MLKSVKHTLSCSVFLLLVISMMGVPVLLMADQAQYFYDELGRVIGVVDGQGNVAVYNYDEVGNLLSIERFATGPTGIGIFFIAPNSALVGTDVKIRGFGFSVTPTDNVVEFNGTGAPVVSASAESITVTVPSNATSGPVTVTNTNGSATSPKDFTVLVPPIVVGVNPDSVPQGTNTRVNVLGFNLADATAVTFTQSGLSATILAGGTDNTLPVRVTVGAGVSEGDYGFSVTTLTGVADSGSTTISVAPAVPSFGLGKASVLRSLPAETPPSGITVVHSPQVSVQVP